MGRQKLLHRMIASIPQLQSAPNFYLITSIIRHIQLFHYCLRYYNYCTVKWLWW